jgi:mRNA-degrading endonuclease RelE of RelBE toxin-antitoxin system
MMIFRIADTFTESLTRLTGDEQKAIKNTAFDLQMNPANPGMNFHRLERAKDGNFWSVRVNNDIRLIVHRSEDSLLLCYVAHHDKAYEWAERRKLEIHPRTGAAQFVEIRETVKHVVVPVYVPTEQGSEKITPENKRPLFSSLSNEDLLSYGVPKEWIEDVRLVDEDSILNLIEHLPAEASEALLELATGGSPKITISASTSVNPFDHPDAQRRFRIMNTAEELKLALDYPWEKWTVFLHPEQRELVEHKYSGPIRISGSAGTGKTIVALHRAVFLAKSDPESRVLLTTFSDPLARALSVRLKRLISGEPHLAERIDIYSLDAIGIRLYKSSFGQPAIASEEDIFEIIREASASVDDHRFSLHFLFSEWDQIVDAWQIDDWESYRDAMRLGRKTRLPEAQRKILWSVFEKVKSILKERKMITQSQLFNSLSSTFSKSRNIPYDYVVVDESQDIGITQLRFLASIGRQKPDSLFFTGDLGQRIFQQPFSWRSLGVDIRGRSRSLRVNYRTSHQIRNRADRLLGPAMTDPDGNSETRKGTVSVFNGPDPVIISLKNENEEIKTASAWMNELAGNGVLPHEFGVFVRSEDQLERAKSAVKNSGMSFVILDDRIESITGHVSICTMHLAKGLEFRAVAVMACDDEVLPLQERIESIGDDADLKEVYDTERHLLYVACTRARDHLLITSVEPASEFLDDMGK